MARRARPEDDEALEDSKAIRRKLEETQAELIEIRRRVPADAYVQAQVEAALESHRRRETDLLARVAEHQEQLRVLQSTLDAERAGVVVERDQALEIAAKAQVHGPTELSHQPFESYRSDQGRRIRLPWSNEVVRDAMLVVLSGNRPGTPHRLQQGHGCSLGRDSSCDVVCDGENISRRHASITIRNNEYHLVDLGSTNGTYLTRMIHQSPSDVVLV
jgi:hypothetical protein